MVIFFPQGKGGAKHKRSAGQGINYGDSCSTSCLCMPQLCIHIGYVVTLVNASCPRVVALDRNKFYRQPDDISSQLILQRSSGEFDSIALSFVRVKFVHMQNVANGVALATARDVVSIF